MGRIILARNNLESSPKRTDQEIDPKTSFSRTIVLEKYPW